MIDIQSAKLKFNEYLKDYNVYDGKIKLKIIHTFKVLDNVKYICNCLNLDEEDTNLAQLIALLHDIGRFEQLKLYNTFLDYESMDHADYGVKILFDDGLIRNFIVTDIYDEIIKAAILNHSKYEIGDNLDPKQLLHSKIIRDADKLDNFRVKQEEKIETLLDITKEELEKQKITDSVYFEFLECKTLKTDTLITKLDRWVGYLALIFGLYFDCSIKYIVENNYMNILFNRLEYKDEDTIYKIDNMKKSVNEYIKSRIGENND